MFIVEGNIGAGKSTFLQLIRIALPEVSVAFEPVHNWQQMIAGSSLLENFYQQPHRWAYTLETYAMISRVIDHLAHQETKQPLKLMERSIYSGHYCFAKNGYLAGFMSDLEWALYNKWFEFLIPDKCHAPRGFIYLKTDPSIAHQRVIKRSRSAENALSLEYLEQIDQAHDSFLLEKKDLHPVLHDVPVLVLECNNEFETNSAEFKKHTKIVREFIYDKSL